MYRSLCHKVEWIQQIVVDCTRNGVPVFVKQMGSAYAKENGMADSKGGGPIENLPNGLQLRMLPTIALIPPRQPIELQTQP